MASVTVYTCNTVIYSSKELGCCTIHALQVFVTTSDQRSGAARGFALVGVPARLSVWYTQLVA